MNVNMDTGIRRISSMRAVRFAQTEEKTDKTLESSDEISVSKEGQQAVSGSTDDGFNDLFAKLDASLGSMTRDEFMNMFKSWVDENQPKLEVDPYFSVDPDGSIATKTYFESYLSQLESNRSAIESYYADAYKDALSGPFNDSMLNIAAKYQCSWSEHFRGDMPDKERQWTFNQLKAMITGTGVALNDPYALKSVGGSKTVDEMDKIAKQAVKDKLDDLIKERGISK